MIVLYQKFYHREDLWANPNVGYVFGDNLEGYGLGGQAKACRGEPNAIGLPTKYTPYAYLSDVDYDLWLGVFQRRLAELQKWPVVVYPYDGIGTGLAALETSAPRIWAEMNRQLNGIGIKNGQ